MTRLVWLRRDLRRGDLPSLLQAGAGGEDVVVCFVIDPRLWDRSGAVRRAWLAQTVRATQESYDGRLLVLCGNPRVLIPDLAVRLGASSVHVTAETTPYGRRRDAAVQEALATNGIGWQPAGTPYAVGPGLVRKQDGQHFSVFTPFERAWHAHGWPLPAISRLTPISAPGRDWRAEHDDAWRIIEDAAEAPGLPGLPEAGEPAALRRWATFLEAGLAGYAEHRDRPDLAGTSHLSPHLKLGTIHPRTLLADLVDRIDQPDAQRFITELAWREFYADVLWHQPNTAWNDLRGNLSGLQYDDPAENTEALVAWQQGQTGYPIVDAGMRQLLATGWMHNRVRMITASFFTKDLHLWWPLGARYFLDHLIDGDLASNNHGWQWVAGTGTDPAPYFRVFNPVLQGQRFDPEGTYVRQWIPELRHIAGVAVHTPWKLADGHVHGYPERIVDHAQERTETLRRLEAAR